MKEIKTNERTPLLLEQLLRVWENSVKATHHFLADNEIEIIKKYVRQALNDISHLVVVENENGFPVGFMGVEGRKLEMLFISSKERGKGLGKDLIRYGIDNYALNELAVNEQNPLAIGFYEHMGFKVYKKADIDEQGNPYPLLYMKWS